MGVRAEGVDDDEQRLSLIPPLPAALLVEPSTAAGGEVEMLVDPFEELPEGDRPRYRCVLHDRLASPTPYNEIWEWQKNVSNNH